MELETNANGVVTFLPLTGWAVVVVMGKSVGLAIDYYASNEDAAAARTSRIQIHIDPAVAREIGRAMASRGDTLLGSAGAAPGG
jgi:hypothetical protein